MLLVDQYALCQLHEINISIQQSYKDRKTTAVFHDLADYCVKELSAFYLDIVKDRLYVEKSNGLDRRSAQTVCYYIVDTLTKLMAPILSVTAELISDCYQHNKNASIHLQDFENLSWVTRHLFNDGVNSIYQCTQKEFEAMWVAMRDMRGFVLKSLEDLRGHGFIKHSLDARVSFYISSYKDHEKIVKLCTMVVQQKQNLELFFKEYFIVSQVAIENQAGDMRQVFPGLFIETSKAIGAKCARCWQWENFDFFDIDRQICSRCTKSL
jgi:isoleucyl-tRNA synthetase